jgi:hypothetical protein
MRPAVVSFDSWFDLMRAENVLLAAEVRALIRERKQQQREAESVRLVVLYLVYRCNLNALP